MQICVCRTGKHCHARTSKEKTRRELSKNGIGSSHPSSSSPSSMVGLMVLLLVEVLLLLWLLLFLLLLVVVFLVRFLLVFLLLSLVFGSWPRRAYMDAVGNSFSEREIA
jgi:uncharacterized membrane protein